MAKLLSVGLDVGTTTTQLVVSALTVENQSSAFSVPELAITQRQVLYQSPVHFTPLVDASHVDGAAIRRMVEQEYRNAGIRRDQVDTGAVIITGETSRKENARAVLEALSDYAGDFVVATAGPELESILAAKGAGAVAYSGRTGKTVLHMDIGGGTSNLALIEDGTVVRTGCLNVGGRLVKLDRNRHITYVSPELEGLTTLAVGQTADPEAIDELVQILTNALEMAAGLQAPTPLLQRLMTKEVTTPWVPPATGVTVSFSGGVADCIFEDQPSGIFGDIGPELGQAIRHSRLCQGDHLRGSQTIRATVIGAGCHSAQLSGSTVYHRGVEFPIKNLPVITLSAAQQCGELAQLLPARMAALDTKRAVIALPGPDTADHRQVAELAQRLALSLPPGPVYICLERDMAKALGQALALRLEPDRPVLCLDRLHLEDGSFLDVGAPTGPALPVVIKTLILSSH